jgi:hypothetical protein
MNVIPIITIERIEVFDWTSPDEVTSVHFPITIMLRAIAKGQVPYERITAQLDPEFARIWISRRDINIPYCLALPKKRRDEPVLGCWMADDTVLLVDGSHRYMARYLRKETTIDYIILKEVDWKPFAILMKGQWP